MAFRRTIALVALGATAASGSAFSGATFTSSSASGANTFTAKSDWLAPTVQLADPGTMRGTVQFAATAADAGSGIASVDFQVRRSGTTTWTTVCSASTAAATCQYDSRGLADGIYDVRAVATDRAGNTAVSTIADRVVDNTTFGVTLTDPGAFLRGAVTLGASVGGSATVSSVRIQIKQSDATTWTTLCTDTTAPYSCPLDTTKYAADLYDLRAQATNSLGTIATSAAIADVQIDNAAPAVTLADPGTMRGAVTLTAAASDADAGLAGVTFQRSPAGAGQWTDICTDETDPYSCRFDTTTSATPDGSYDLRAIATDHAGNTTISVRAARTIDNTVFSVSLADPGDYLRGTIRLEATATAGTIGVKSVTVEARPSGTTTWKAICTDATSPYSCPLDTTTLSDGLYDFRAVMTPTSGADVMSDVVPGRQIDNGAMRGLDLQADNKTGGIFGRLETGDVLRLTWSEPVKAASLQSGWAGTAAQGVTVRLRDAGTRDFLEFPNNPALGSVALGGNYVRTNKTITFASSMTLSGATLTITLGSSSGGGPRTWSTPTAMTWTPSAQATDLTGNPSSTAPVTESGTNDKDF